MTTRHAEIAGAGLVGLTAATLLAHSSWSVRVHERASSLREVGAGLFLWRNALEALEEAGVLASVSGGFERLTCWQRFDEHGRLVFQRRFEPSTASGGVSAGPVVVRRGDLHRALVEAAQRAGVQIVTDSEVAGADPDGALRLRDGTVRRADLVVAADGVRSRVRSELGLTCRLITLGSGGSRFLIARARGEMPGQAREYKHGHRSVGVVPCGDRLYVYLECRADDALARRIPLDPAWGKSFPQLRAVLARLPEDGEWAEFVRVRCSSWSAGHVVLVGDAAHAMPPHLSQGACLGMANVRSLVAALGRIDGVPAALRAWEATDRPITDLTQRWATAYARISTHWPPRLLGLRSVALRAADRSRYVRSQTGRAARYESRFGRAQGPG